jgi:hypothetical protein
MSVLDKDLGTQPRHTSPQRQQGDRFPLLALRACVSVLLIAPLAAAQPATPQFRITTASGPTHTGALDTLDADWSVRLLDGLTSIRVPGSELVTLRRVDLPLPAYPSGAQVVFVNGDRVPLHASPELRLERDCLHFRPQALLPAGEAGFEPPLRTVALLWLAAPPRIDDPALTLHRLRTEPRRHDLVLLRDGDRVEGTLTELARGSCRVRAGRRVVDLPLARVAVIALAGELRAPGLPPRPYGHLVLSDGCRLALASARVDAKGGMLIGKTLFGSAIEAPLERVAALDLRQGAAVYLSDLEPTAYEHTPFLGVSWPYTRDAAVAGGPMRLAGSTHDKGLGMHSESRLTYDLGGRYRRFEVDVGLDERTGKRGQVRIEVLVDGKPRPLGNSGELTAADGPLRLRLDVRGARTLTLVVRFGRFGDVQGHVNWADARVIR